MSSAQHIVENLIRAMYYRLTDEEFSTRKERRDEFFMAVRKKHGIARAQAERFLLDLEGQFHTFSM